jgi:tripartite-type tricarboxylate transporter receptor subunit TctC
MHAPRIQRRKATLATGVLAALSAIGSVAAPAIAHAQAAIWPQRPVRVIVPNGPGASSDTLARVLALKLGETVGQQFVVDNRPGAGGLIGMEIAARAVPDGYTLLATSTANHVIAPQLHRKLNFDVFKDFQPISLYGVTQNVLVVHPSMPAKTAQELIALLKATPGKYNMASAGSGSQSHLAGVQLMLAARTESTHVPYKGGGASVGAVVANESQFTFTPIAATNMMTACRRAEKDCRSSIVPMYTRTKVATMVPRMASGTAPTAGKTRQEAKIPTKIPTPPQRGIGST